MFDDNAMDISLVENTGVQQNEIHRAVSADDFAQVPNIDEDVGRARGKLEGKKNIFVPI